MITFGDGAEDILREVVERIPAGYTISLLDHGQEPADGYQPGVDYTLIATTHEGLLVGDFLDYNELDPDPVLRPWGSFDRIHVY